MTGLKIDAKEGEEIQIGQSTVVVESARNGKLAVRVIAPRDVSVRRPVREKISPAKTV